MDLNDLLSKGDEFFLPNHSVDIVVIGYEGKTLKALLLQFDHRWMLPGGYIYRDESIEDAALRILRSRTGLEHSYLNQFKVFGDASRRFPGELKEIFARLGMPWKEDAWVNQRFISTAYYALVDINRTLPTGGIFAEQFAWHGIKELPPMMFDHGKIAFEAITHLRSDTTLNYRSHNLMPDQFTMPELHHLHEVILEKKLDRSRFQKKMISLDIFERLPKPKDGVPHKRPFLYKVKK